MTGPIPDLGLIPTTTVTVTRRVATGTDALNATTYTTEDEQVPGVVVTPGATSDLDASRPDGVAVALTFHFPKGYGGSLRGCSVTYGGRSYRVIGDPRPYMEDGTPGALSLPVECEAVDG